MFQSFLRKIFASLLEICLLAKSQKYEKKKFDLYKLNLDQRRVQLLGSCFGTLLSMYMAKRNK